ncbi:MAG: putative lipid II flippase FtsW, partial [Gaiellaceae bacterium]
GQESRRRRPRPKLQIEFKLLVLATLGLVAFGLVMVYSATSASAALGGESSSAYLERQAIYALAGLGGLVFCSRFDFLRWRLAAPPLLVISLGLCLAVLAIGVQINGARRWFNFGPLSFQPSELVKLALAVWISARLARRPPPADLMGLLRPVGAIVALACGLVLLEPDLGTAIAIAVMVSAALLVAGTKLGLLLRAGAVAGALTVAAVWSQPYRLARLTAFVDPWQHAQATGYQNVQALISVGSGGIFGRGLGEGVQKIHYLPEARTDMIAAVIGEELGLIGILVLVLAYGVLALAGLRIALRCRDRYGKILAAALTTLLCGQATINLAAVLGLAPVTGIPLPFVSYGGSSMIVSLLAIGILLNIAVNHGREPKTAVRGGGRRDRRPPDARSRRR